MKQGLRAVFIDRDGVLIRDVNYLRSVAGLSVLRGAPEALRILRAAGFKVVVVTNQSGVARGCFTMRTLRAIHAELKRRLAKSGARWDALYVSPHGPDSRHPWRKPGTGMLSAAKRRFGLDMKASYLVGDKTSDIECARRAGCASVLVRTGKGGRDREYKVKPTAVRSDLLSAARWIIAHADSRYP
ncbi:MAG: HAD family hydrolase [Elusimicrobia bacterium]|nr:HAD family hydrolase [Elusimicrobiota bacterium]